MDVAGGQDNPPGHGQGSTRTYDGNPGGAFQVTGLPDRGLYPQVKAVGHGYLYLGIGAYRSQDPDPFQDTPGTDNGDRFPSGILPWLAEFPVDGQFIAGPKKGIQILPAKMNMAVGYPHGYFDRQEVGIAKL